MLYRFIQRANRLVRYSCGLFAGLNPGSSRAALLIRVIAELRASVELSSAVGAVGICFWEAAFPFSATL